MTGKTLKACSLLLAATLIFFGAWKSGVFEKESGGAKPDGTADGQRPVKKTPAKEMFSPEELDQELDRLRLEQDPGGRTRMLDFLAAKLRRWTLEDPEAASTWAARHYKGSGIPPELIHVVASAWASGDMLKAMQWVCQLPNHEPFESTVLSIGYQAVAKDPAALLEVAVKLPLGERGGRNDLVIHTVNHWAVKEPQTALAWAKRIEDPALRPRVLSALAITWSESDPQSAANLALETLPAGKLQNEALVGIVQRWAQRDPSKVADWVLAFPPGELRQASLDNVVTLWADQDAEEAGRWLNRLEPGETRNAAVGSFVSKVAHFAPEVAAVWAGSISEPGLRSRQLENVGRAWLALDEEAAKAWIGSSGLSDAAKSRLLGSE